MFFFIFILPDVLCVRLHGWLSHSFWKLFGSYLFTCIFCFFLSFLHWSSYTHVSIVWCYSIALEYSVQFCLISLSLCVSVWVISISLSVVKFIFFFIYCVQSFNKLIKGFFGMGVSDIMFFMSSIFIWHFKKMISLNFLLYLKMPSFILSFLVSCCTLPEAGVSEAYGLTVWAAGTWYVS